MATHHVDAAIKALAADQYDAFTRQQSLALGASAPMIKRRLRTGAWLPTPANGVYLLGARGPSWRQELWVAHLEVGLDSVISHEAGAALLPLPGFAEGPVVVMVRHPSHRQVSRGTLHQSTDLVPAHVTTRSGLPVTTPQRTFVDLASVLRKPRLHAALETAIIEKRVQLEKVSACLLSLARPGKRGVFVLGEIIDELGPGEIPPGSVLEAVLFDALAAAGDPAPIRQYPHPGRLPTPGCVDAAYRGARLIIEVDGRRWHTRRQDIQRDHARDMAAARAGWETLRVVFEDLRNWPEDTLDTIRVIRTSREAVVAALS